MSTRRLVAILGICILTASAAGCWGGVTGVEVIEGSSYRATPTEAAAAAKSALDASEAMVASSTVDPSEGGTVESRPVSGAVLSIIIQPGEDPQSVQVVTKLSAQGDEIAPAAKAAYQQALNELDRLLGPK